MDHTAILMRLPLATHIKNVILTLDSLDLKLAFISETHSPPSATELEMLMLLSERFAHQKIRTDRAIAEIRSSGEKPKRDLQ